MRLYNSKFLRLDYIKQFLALGIGGELTSTFDYFPPDNHILKWTLLHIKIYMGPLVININFPVTPKKPKGET